VTVSLDAGSSRLEYSVDVDWHEIGRKGEGIPQLNFFLPVAYPVRAYRYDIPFGTVERASAPLDVPGNSWGAALPAQAGDRGKGDGQPFVQIITEGNYGFRGDENGLALTLLRSSFDPDPHPELGIHRIRFAVEAAPGTATKGSLISAAYDYTHPVEVFSGAGAQPSRMSFAALVSGSAAVAAVKTPADGAQGELIVRIYETEGQPTQAVLRFEPMTAGRIHEAKWVDSHEQPIGGFAPLRLDGERLIVPLAAHQLGAVRIKFE
jgi:alpha-mannosidase